MCNTYWAWHKPCGKVHIKTKCDNKKNCRTYQAALAQQKKGYKNTKCDTCNGVPLYVQVWHSAQSQLKSILKMLHIMWIWKAIKRYTRLIYRKIWKRISWAFRWILSCLDRILDILLGLPTGKGRGKYWPNTLTGWLIFALRAAAILGALGFAISWTFTYFHVFGFGVPWYQKAFYNVAYPITQPLKWSWYKLAGPRRNFVEKVLHWMWKHTPDEVKTFFYFARGIWTYYVTWTACNMNCRVFTANGLTRDVRVAGCKWNCFNRLHKW